MMCSSTARPAPRRRSAFGVRIDLTSPSVALSAFNAPQPTSTVPSQSDQNVMSGARSLARSSACTLSGGESSYMLARCSSKSARTCGRVRSSISMRMPYRPATAWAALERPAVDMLHRQRVVVHALEAAHVDHRHLVALAVLAHAIG